MALIIQPQRWDVSDDAEMMEVPDGDYVLFEDAVAWVEHAKTQERPVSVAPMPGSALAEMAEKVTAWEKAWHEGDAIRTKLEERISELTKIKYEKGAEIKRLRGELAEAKQSLHDIGAALLLNLRGRIGAPNGDPVKAAKDLIRAAFPDARERGEVSPEDMYPTILHHVARRAAQAGQQEAAERFL